MGNFNRNITQVYQDFESNLTLAKTFYNDAVVDIGLDKYLHKPCSLDFIQIHDRVRNIVYRCLDRPRLL